MLAIAELAVIELTIVMVKVKCFDMQVQATGAPAFVSETFCV